MGSRLQALEAHVHQAIAAERSQIAREIARDLTRGRTRSPREIARDPQAIAAERSRADTLSSIAAEVSALASASARDRSSAQDGLAALSASLGGQMRDAQAWPLACLGASGRETSCMSASMK